MRVRAVAVGVILAVGATASTTALGQGDSAPNAASQALARAGEAALGRGQGKAAFESYEAALAADPKNQAAFVGLARSSEAMGLPGKAVKYYREALQLDPNNLAALEGQGEALVQRGAVARAQVNLDRIKQLCKGSCAPADKLAAVIAKGAPKTVAVVTPPEAPAKN